MDGTRLKKLREEKKLKQEELANILSISASSIGMYERNLREPDDDLKLKISKYFNCSIDYLVGKTDIRNYEYEEKKSNNKEDFFMMLHIKEIRKKQGLTQYDLADKLQTTQQRISSYENGKREPDLVTLSQIADILNVSTDTLLGRQQNSFDINSIILKYDPPTEKQKKLIYELVEVILKNP